MRASMSALQRGCATSFPLHRAFVMPHTIWRRSWALELMMLRMVCRANIKVSSTETGAIFGNVVYETTGASERSVVRPFRPAHAALARHVRPDVGCVKARARLPCSGLPRR